MRVMLSKNTDPSRGLINGAVGTITNMTPIKCRTTNNSHVTPQTVTAKFDAVKINSSNSESVGLNPFTKQFFWPKGVSLCPVGQQESTKFKVLHCLKQSLMQMKLSFKMACHFLP